MTKTEALTLKCFGVGEVVVDIVSSTVMCAIMDRGGS